MLKDFDEFFRFCFEHGKTLRAHKAFGAMANDLRLKIEAKEKEAAQLRLQWTGLYCQLCGEPLLEHFVTENGGHCQPPRN